MKTSRTLNIVAWVCIALVAAFNLFAAVMKFMPITDPAAIEMSQKLGVVGLEHGLGVLEFIIIALYVWPRSSTVGFVLMIGYMGGALATNLTHGFTHVEALPIYISFVLMTIAAYIRNPELTSRLLKRPYPAR